jgi:MscS family membrane protein
MNAILEDKILSQIVVAVGIVVGFAIIGRLAKWLMGSRLSDRLTSNRTETFRRILRAIRRHIISAFMIAGVYAGVEDVRSVLTEDNVIHHKVLDYITIGLYIALVFVVTRLVTEMVKALMEWYMESISEQSHRKINPAAAPVASKILNLLLIITATLVALDHVGVNVSSFIVSLGVGSLAVALAAQETISNLIGWFVIVLDQPFRIGDTVRLSTGEEGSVRTIGLRATRIVNGDNNLVVIPNGDMAKAHVTNMSAPDDSTSVSVDIKVGYGANIQSVREIMLSCAKKNPNLPPENPPQVYVTNLGDIGVTLRLGSQTHYGIKFNVETALREEIYNALQQNGIPFAVAVPVFPTKVPA